MSTELSKNATEKKTFLRARVDVFENDAEYLLVADLPGVAKEAVDIRFDRGELTIEATRSADSFARAFAMPEGIDAEKIDAKLQNGVLAVHVPKAAAKRARRIDVRAL